MHVPLPRAHHGPPTWPTGPLACVPGDDGAHAMAWRVRRAILGQGCEDEPLLDLSSVCDAARVSVKEQILSAALRGQEALLTPHNGDSFAIVVDTTPRGGWGDGDGVDTREEVRRHRLRFRVGHELGHTFFYWRDGGRPRRHLLDSANQERFCDTFSRALLVPPAAVAQLPVSSQTVIYLQRTYDVSLEVAARALAAAHPDARVGLWFAPADDAPRLQLQWSSGGFDSPAVADVPPGATSSIHHGDWLPQRRQYLVCLP